MCRAWVGLLELPIDAGNVRRGLALLLTCANKYSIYQEYTVKAMTEKHNTLNVQVDKILNDANSELNILNQKLHSMIRNVTSTFTTNFKQTCKSTRTGSRPRIRIS